MALKRKASASSMASPRKMQRRGSKNIPRTVSQDYRLFSPVKQEFKCWDWATSQSSTTTGAVLSLVGGGAAGALSRGNDYLQDFIGQNLNIVGVQLKWFVQGSASSTVVPDPYNLTRIIFFQWFDSSSPNPAGILQGYAGSYGSELNCLSPVLLTNRENISILMDKLYTTWQVTSYGASGNSTCHVGKRYIKGKRFGPVQMDVGTASYQKGGLYMLVLGDSSVAPSPEVSFYVRVTFTD